MVPSTDRSAVSICILFVAIAVFPTSNASSTAPLLTSTVSSKSSTTIQIQATTTASPSKSADPTSTSQVLTTTKAQSTVATALRTTTIPTTSTTTTTTAAPTTSSDVQTSTVTATTTAGTTSAPDTTIQVLTTAGETSTATVATTITAATATATTTATITEPRTTLAATTSAAEPTSASQVLTTTAAQNTVTTLNTTTIATNSTTGPTTAEPTTYTYVQTRTATSSTTAGTTSAPATTIQVLTTTGEPSTATFIQLSEYMCLKTDCTRAYGCTKDEKGNEMCFCRSGYRLIANKSCEDINECDQYICSQDCENIAGSFKCKCFPGYTLDTDKTTCTPCIFPYYGENCSNVCECGMGAKRCDPLKGCICESGWAGSRCDQDVNECLQNPFICNNTLKDCINNIGSYACNCITGYKATNDTCTDINECDDPTTNTCEQTCINTLSGFTCACWPGYKKDPNGLTKCIDIDECASGLSECDQECSNSIGRFSCSCYFGYELTLDRKTCIHVTYVVVEEDPCLKYGNLTCDQICVVNLTTESSTCACNRGYKLSLDNKTCEDINECTEMNGTLNQCGNKVGCNNTNGSYKCSCEDGSKLENDGRTCSTCDDFHYGPNCANQCNCSVGVLRCDNKTGCVCKPGWDGDLCNLDIDECRNTSVCRGENNNCVNTPGSYKCMCKDGYEKNATDSCVDVNECIDNKLNQCEQICINTIGGYNCSCISGYLPDDDSCLDINECLLNNDTCPQACQNTNGTHRCVCYKGFEGNGTMCTPASEMEVASYNITFSFNINVSQMLNNNPEYIKYLYDVNETLSIYFEEQMGNSFIIIENIKLWAGSLNARCSFIIRKSAISLLVSELSRTLDQHFTIRGEKVTVLSLEVNGYHVSKTGIQCELYLHLIQTCPHGYTCSTDENGPSCRPIYLTDDNFALIIGLGIGIPLGVICILQVIGVTMNCRKVRRKGKPLYNKSSAIKEGFPQFSIPTRLLSNAYIGHGSETYKWEEDSHKASNTYHRTDNTWKSHHLGPFIQESHVYEDIEAVQESNVSWDFMLQHMEKYEIKRPNKLQTPNPIYALPHRSYLN